MGLVAGLACLALAGCPRYVADSASYQASNAQMLRTALEGDKAASAGPTVAAAQPTGWATLRGKFTLTGNAPAPTAE
jgi:hypothetical protein